MGFLQLLRRFGSGSLLVTQSTRLFAGFTERFLFTCVGRFEFVALARIYLKVTRPTKLFIESRKLFLIFARQARGLIKPPSNCSADEIRLGKVELVRMRNDMGSITPPAENESEFQ